MHLTYQYKWAAGMCISSRKFQLLSQEIFENIYKDFFSEWLMWNKSKAKFLPTVDKNAIAAYLQFHRFPLKTFKNNECQASKRTL